MDDDDTYIVLRIDGVPKRKLGGLQSLGAASPDTLDFAAATDTPKITVEIAQLSPEQRKKESLDAANSLSRGFPIVHIQSDGPSLAGDAATDAAIKAAEQAGMAWGVRAVEADAAHLEGAGKDVVVAVLDTGIDRNHPAFPKEGLAIEEKNFTIGNDADTNGHGTHCASVIFGRNVNGLRIGVAPAIRKALVGKVFDDEGRSSNEILVNALSWAREKKANVVSLSLGFDFPSMLQKLKCAGIDELPAMSQTLSRYREALAQLQNLIAGMALETIDSAGILVVAAAGNQSARDAPKPYRIEAGVPACIDAVLSAGAVGQAAAGFTIARFSNSKPEVLGPGVGILGAKNGGGLVAKDGTSMACPHVAGVAALWWDRENTVMAGGVRASRVAAQVRTSTRRLKGLDPDDQGGGLVRAPPAE